MEPSDSERKNKNIPAGSNGSGKWGAGIIPVFMGIILLFLFNVPFGRLVAHRISRIYHRPDCKYGRMISSENRKYGRSARRMQDEGFRACRVCNPAERSGK